MDKIIERKGHFCICVKKNQGDLYGGIETRFDLSNKNVFLRRTARDVGSDGLESVNVFCCQMWVASIISLFGNMRVVGEIVNT
ncbi:MAG: hypothetical protein LBE76_08295 [Nitrososphaerota archaeon]|jgi:hypothetical protein|nr:hypothetical protein [Nitrososphaerota archaeon]